MSTANDRVMVNSAELTAAVKLVAESYQTFRQVLTRDSLDAMARYEGVLHLALAARDAVNSLLASSRPAENFGEDAATRGVPLSIAYEAAQVLARYGTVTGSTLRVGSDTATQGAVVLSLQYTVIME